MPVSFLDLVPKRPSATVAIETEDGSAQYEISGLPLSALADIGRKFPAFALVVEGNASLMTATAAMPALIAAGLGHPGDHDYEQKAAQLPSDLIISLASEVVKLTFPQRPILVVDGEAASAAPMAETGNGLLPEPILPSQLNS